MCDDRREDHSFRIALAPKLATFCQTTLRRPEPEGDNIVRQRSPTGTRVPHGVAGGRKYVALASFDFVSTKNVFPRGPAELRC